MTKTVTVRNRAPVASFGPADLDVDTGEPIDFASSSSDPDGSVTSYAWDFDNNGSTDATGATVRHSYADNGVEDGAPDRDR